MVLIRLVIYGNKISAKKYHKPQKILDYNATEAAIEKLIYIFEMFNISAKKFQMLRILIGTQRRIFLEELVKNIYSRERISFKQGSQIL